MSELALSSYPIDRCGEIKRSGQNLLQMLTIVSYVTILDPLLGRMVSVVSHRLSGNWAIDINIELNTFITWNLVSPLASLKPNPREISGVNSGAVRSQFLRWSYQLWRSFITRQLAKFKLYQLIYHWQCDLNSSRRIQYESLCVQFPIPSKMQLGRLISPGFYRIGAFCFGLSPHPRST